jgi:hypothetical protein
MPARHGLPSLAASRVEVAIIVAMALLTTDLAAHNAGVKAPLDGDKEGGQTPDRDHRTGRAAHLLGSRAGGDDHFYQAGGDRDPSGGAHPHQER